MKYITDKKIGKEYVVVTVSLQDTCGNGSDDFSITMDWYSTNKRKGEHTIKKEGRNYYMESGGLNKNIIKEHFPELTIFLTLSGKDAFGVPVYPIMNTMYHFKNNFEYACEEIQITLEKGEEVKKLSDYYFSEFLKEQIENVLQPQAEEGIKILEDLTEEKYNRVGKISPHLFNDIHYKFVTEKKGWNVHKALENKDYLTYADVLNIN